MMYKNHVQCGFGSLNDSARQNTWKIFKFPIAYYNSDVPDSAVIQLGSYGMNEVVVGNSMLYIDNLNFNPVFGVGTDPVSPKKDFVIYPNPAQNMLNIVTDISNRGQVYHIYNSSGTLVKSVTLSDEHNRVNIQDLSAGVYFVRPNGSAVSVRFVKQ